MSDTGSVSDTEVRFGTAPAAFDCRKAKILKNFGFYFSAGIFFSAGDLVK